MSLNQTTKSLASLFIVFVFFSTTSFGQLYTKLQWMPQDNLWGVFVRTDSSVNPSQNILLGSGQITLVTPTGFEIQGLASYMGTWVQNARANKPEENKEKDYISFGIKVSEPITELGLYDEALILTFQSKSPDCPSSLYLIENDDPFASNSPNSLNTNPGNDLQMLDLGNNRFIYKYEGNYDLDSWNCNADNILSTSVVDFKRRPLVKVFPNPFQQSLIFELINKKQKPNLEIKIIDNLGRLVHSQVMNKFRLKVDIKSEKALYLYQIIDLETKELVESGKLFKH